MQAKRTILAVRDRLPHSSQAGSAARRCLAVCCTALAFALSTGDSRGESPGGGLVVTPVAPTDILGGAPKARLVDAARFAWHQFIALNWPAVPQTGAAGTRGTVDPNRTLVEPPGEDLLAWETLRSKSEVFPGIGDPHGRAEGPELDYGYDDPPQYVFDPASVGSYETLPQGTVPPCDPASAAETTVPWVNLSEAHEAGPEDVFAGIVPVEVGGQAARVLYTVKVNRPQYVYIAANNWYGGGNPDSTIPSEATADYIATHFRAPPPGTAQYVSFPPGSLEIKGAWRLLTEAEAESGRFHTARVRSYDWQEADQTYDGRPGDPKLMCYEDGRMGLVGMHIKLKTPSAPYYVWATFEQADNLLDPAGNPVEDEDGRVTSAKDLPPTDPPIWSRNAVSADPETPDSIQKLSPDKAASVPKHRLYYANPKDTPTTQGIISANRRRLPIPETVVAVNAEAHAALRQYAKDHGIPVSPWAHYKLVGVQWRPANKPRPGQDLEPDLGNPNEVLAYPGIYYTSNMVIETSHRLQLWSGHIQRPLPPPNQDVPVNNLITDFTPDGAPVKNVQFDDQIPDGKKPGFNMGGCMGCHGQMQATGYGFSFILRRGRVTVPEIDDPRRPKLQDMIFVDN
jgi:hypothetical protein